MFVSPFVIVVTVFSFLVCMSVNVCHVSSIILPSNHSEIVIAKICGPVPLFPCSPIDTMWLKRINQNGGLLGRPVRVRTYDLSITRESATESVIANATRLLLENGFHAFIAPAGDAAAWALPILESHKVISILPLTPTDSAYVCDATMQIPCKAPNTRRFAYAYGALNPSSLYWSSFVGLLKMKGATSIALIGQTDLPFYTYAYDGVIRATRDNKINIVFKMFPSYIPNKPFYFEPSQVTYIVDEFQRLKPDAVIFVTNRCQEILLEMRARNYMPAAVSVNQPEGTFTDPDKQWIMQYTVGPTQWDYRLTGEHYTETPLSKSSPWLQSDTGNTDPSPLQFHQAYINYTNGTKPSYPLAANYIAYQILENAILLANTTETQALARELNKMYMPTFWGIVSFSAFGYNQQKVMALYQRDVNNINQVVAPIQAATMDFIYPIPNWNEREYVHRMFSTPTDHAIIVLVVLSCCIHLIIGIGLIIFRKDPSVRATSVSFSVMMCFGAIIACCSVLTWPIENNTATCMARMFLLPMGFQCYVSPLLVKSYRVARIFNSRQFSSLPISTHRMIWYMVGIMLPQLIISIVWMTVNPLQPKIVVADGLRPVYNYETCSGSSSDIYLNLTLAYSSLCLFVACLLAIGVSRAYDMFNDARYIAFSVYLFTMTAIVITGVQMSDNGNDTVVYAIRSIGMLLAYTVSGGVQFAPHFIAAVKKTGVRISFQPSGSKSNDTVGRRAAHVAAAAADVKLVGIKNKPYRSSSMDHKFEIMQQTSQHSTCITCSQCQTKINAPQTSPTDPAPATATATAPTPTPSPAAASAPVLSPRHSTTIAWDAAVSVPIIPVSK